MATEPTSQPVKSLFQAVVDLSAEHRAAYLDEHCDDADVRAEVEQLLGLHTQATSTDLRPAAEQLVTMTPRRETDFEPFETLDEFRVLRKLGEGGMAVVYLAEDTSLERLVALKILPSAYTRSDERVARFRREAITVAQLHHDGIVPVHRVGRARGIYYIAMEYVEGMTIAEALDELRRLPSSERDARIEQLPYLREQADLIAQIADALYHTHEHDIVHRDVKPSNIIIAPDGQARLTDFGIARDVNRETVTASGHFAGTYAYMSPEQARAQSSSVDNRTDIFSLGVVLYEMLTLVQPFSGATAQEIITQVISKQPRKLRQCNPAASKDLETICHKALEKDPSHRYQTAAHFAADLRCYMSDRPILARPPSVYRRARVWVRDHKARALVGALAALVLIVAGLTAVLVAERRTRMAVMSISTNREGAVVYMQRVDHATLEVGERILLGDAPIERRLLEPAQYRVTVVADEITFAEATLLLDRATELSLDLPVPDDVALIHVDMILLAGRTFSFGEHARPDALAPRRVELQAYWIDRHEVSNADYMAFVQATGHEQPRHWERFGYDPEYADRPVVGITVGDAQAYALWKGKRLPSVYEWEGAMRAPDDRLLPWGDDGPECGRNKLTVDDLQRLRAGRWPLAYEQYKKHARPVSADPACATPLGLAHASTNVSEYTESIFFEQSNAVIVKGASWMETPAYFNLSNTWTMPMSTVSPNIGFRCARSAAPLRTP